LCFFIFEFVISSIRIEIENIQEIQNVSYGEQIKCYLFIQDIIFGIVIDV